MFNVFYLFHVEMYTVDDLTNLLISCLYAENEIFFNDNHILEVQLS